MAFGATIQKTMQQLLRNYRSHIRYAAGSGICLTFMTMEILAWKSFTAIGVAFTVIYALLLAVLPLLPETASVGLSVLSVVKSLLPVLVVGPSDFWGTWYALGVLGLRRKPLIPVICVAANVMASFSGVVFGGEAPTVGDVGLACSYVLSGLAGFAIQKQTSAMRAQKERELSEQRLRFQTERLENLHVLHDRIAGELTHVIQRSRLWRSDPDVDPAAKQEIQDLEGMVSEVLHQLREQVIEPARRTLESIPVPEIQGSDGERILHQRTCAAERKLAALGFTGCIEIIGIDEFADTGQCLEVARMIDELSNNIAKYGRPGEYLFRITFDTDAVSVLSSNLTLQDKPSDLGTSGLGLHLIESAVKERGGSMDCNADEHEWTMAIRLPRDARPQ